MHLKEVTNTGYTPFSPGYAPGRLEYLRRVLPVDRSPEARPVTCVSSASRKHVLEERLDPWREKMSGMPLFIDRERTV